MYLFTNYYIAQENEYVFELKEKLSMKFIGGGILVAIGIIYVLLLLENGKIHLLSTAEHFIFTIGLIHICVGLVPIITKSYISVNLKESILIYLGGWRRLLFHPIVIPFKEISHIVIKKQAGGYGPDYDEIFLRQKNKSDIKIDKSRNQHYVNEITYKISKYVECPIYNEN